MTLVKAYELECPNCKTVAVQNVYHTINSSEVDAGKRIINHEINFVVCETCGNKFQLLTPLLYVNFKYQFALRYTASQIEQNEEENKNQKMNHGGASFIFNPLNISDWDEFKNKIRELEGI